MQIKRYYAKTKGQPYEDLNFIRRISELRNSDGTTNDSLYMKTTTDVTHLNISLSYLF